MIRLKALNDNSDNSEDEDAPTITKEALEHAAYSDYNKALHYIKRNQLEEAKGKLQLLIKNSFLTEVDNVPKKDISSHPALALKYGCYKNLGKISELQEDYESCLEYYLKSTSIDPSNITIWFKIGTVSKKLKKYLLAVEAYKQALEYSPNHWPSLENLIILLFAINDYLSCLFYIVKALEKSSYFLTGIVIKNYILEEQPSIADDFSNYFLECSSLTSEDIVDPKEEGLILEQALALQAEYCQEHCSSLKDKPEQIIGSPANLTHSWLSVGEILIQIYQHITKNNLRQCTPINLSSSKLDICIETPTINDQPQQSESMEVDIKIEEPPADRTSGNNTQIQSATESDGQSGAAPSSNTDAEEEARGGRGKRRRSSLTLMELWSGKRRSARVRSGIVGRRNVEEREVDISQLEQALRDLMPESLLPIEDKPKDKSLKVNEDSQDTMELYKQFENIQKDSESASKSYFGSNPEENDVKEYINCVKDCHIFDHAEKYVSSLSNKWNTPWPLKLLSLYIKIYEIFRPTGCINDVYGKEGEAAYKDTLITICYAEGLVNLEDTNQLKSSMGDLFAILPSSKVEDPIIKLRILWFIAIALLKVKDINQAISVLEELEFIMEKSEIKVVKLPNSSKYNTISLEIVGSMLATLKRTENLRVVACYRMEGRHEELAKVLQTTFQENIPNGTNLSVATNLIPSSVISRSNIDSDHLPNRPTQIIWLVDAFLQLDQFKECLLWSEVGLHEVITKLENLSSASSGNNEVSNEQQTIWAKTAETLLVLVEWLLNTQGIEILDFLSSSKTLPRLVRSLVAIVCYQLDFQESPVEMPIDSIAPWILLHKILLRENEKKNNSERHPEEDSIDFEEGSPVPDHVKLLFIAHEFLAKKSWCCMKEGAFLYYIMDTLIPNLIPNGKLIGIKGKIMQDLEQVFYCLYDHPSKKNKTKYLQEHGVPALQLTLKRGLQLFNLYTNSINELPEFDSNQPGPLNAELEPLFRRIVTLITPQEDPAQLVDKMKLFINGSTKEMPKLAPNQKISSNLRCIYYILADYYFKNNDLDKAIQFYTLDVCIEPVRLDSWAGLGLARASQLEIKLNSCEQVKNEAEFLKKADEAEVCFRQALRLGPSQSTLWIEFGSFVYMMHSFCSRLLKQETTSLSLEMFDILEAKKETMLDSAVDCFTKANKVWYSIGESLGLQDERWLHQYMLGKVAEKRDKEKHSYLNHYCKAFELLEACNAAYPEVIAYNNPQNLAVEALEIYYRIHASILKRLEENERSGLAASSYEVLEKILDIAQKCPFMLRSKKYDTQKDNETQNKRSINEIEETEENIPTKKLKLNTTLDQVNNSDHEVHEIMEDLITNVDTNVNNQNSDKEKTRDKKVSQEEELPAQEDIPIPSPSSNGKKHSDEKKLNKDANDSEITSSNEEEDDASSSSEADEESSSAEEDNSENEDDDSDNIDDSDNDEETTTESTTESSSSQNTSSKTSANINKNKQISEKQSLVPVGDEPKKNVWPLIERCIEALENCLSRFPQHYKSLFRLAHFYFRSTNHSNLEYAQELLLGNNYKTKTSQNIQGLFADRKNTNFFNGVWRIPVSEVDRPGSFASHMSRCIQLLMEVLTRMKDSTTLLQLYSCLRVTPDADKKYLRESEREQLAQEALSLCQQAFRAKTREHEQPSVQHLLDIHKAYNRVQKHLPPKMATTFGSLLVDAYKKRIGSENSSFDQAVKFCVQERANQRAARARVEAEALAKQQSLNTPNIPNSSASSSNITTNSNPLIGQSPTTVPPTITTPTTTIPSNYNQLLSTSGLPSSPKLDSTHNYLEWHQAAARSASIYSSLLSAAALQLSSPLVPQLAKTSLSSSFPTTTTITPSSSSITDSTQILQSFAAVAAAAVAAAAPSVSGLSSLTNPGLLAAATSVTSRTNSPNISRQGHSSLSKTALINSSPVLSKNMSSPTSSRTSQGMKSPFSSPTSTLSVNPVLRNPQGASPVLPPLFRGSPFIHPNLQLPRSPITSKPKYGKVGRPPGPSLLKKSATTAANPISITTSPSLYSPSITQPAPSNSSPISRKKPESTHKEAALDLSLSLPASITITPKYLNDQSPICQKDKVTITEVVSKPENKNLQITKPENKNLQITKPENKNLQITKSENKNLQIIKPENKNLQITKSENKNVQITKSENKNIQITKSENKNVQITKSENKNIQITKSENKNVQITKSENKNVQINKPEMKSPQVTNKFETKNTQLITKTDSMNIVACTSSKSESKIVKNDKINQVLKPDSKTSVEVITLE